MIRFLFLFALAFLAFVLTMRYINAAPAEKKGSRKITALLVALTVVFIILVLLHRMHWLGPIAPALVLAGRKLKDFFSGAPTSKTTDSKNDKNDKFTIT